MGFKQHVLLESLQPGAEFVQSTFHHKLYQGLNQKNSFVQHDLKTILADLKITDDFLLNQITKSIHEEAGGLRCIGTATKTRPLTVTAAQLDVSDSAMQATVNT